MILIWFLFVTASMALNPDTHVKKLYYEGCEGKDWRVTDLSMNSNGSNMDVLAVIGYNTSDTLYEVKMTLVNCSTDYKCGGHRDVKVTDIDCKADDISSMEREACGVAKKMAEMGHETGPMTQEFRKNEEDDDSKQLCINYQTESVDGNTYTRQETSNRRY